MKTYPGENTLARRMRTEEEKAAMVAKSRHQHRFPDRPDHRLSTHDGSRTLTSCTECMAIKIAFVVDVHEPPMRSCVIVEPSGTVQNAES